MCPPALDRFWRKKVKKILLVFIIFIICLQTYAQKSEFFPYSENYNKDIDSILATNAQKILLGDTSKVETSISDFDLAKLSNKDLRFLRNMIYAKHGHIFTSEDLTKYYSIFEWYKPVKKVSDKDLTENELNIIERIKSFETRNEKSKSKTEKSDLTGFWQDSLPIVASGYYQGFVFMNDKELKWKVSEMKTLGSFYGYEGTYEIKGNVLIYYVKSAAYLEAFPNYEEWVPGWESYQEWGKDSHLIKISFSEPLVFKFPISVISQKDVQWWDEKIPRVTVEIGSNEFYQILKDPERLY